MKSFRYTALLFALLLIGAILLNKRIKTKHTKLAKRISQLEHALANVNSTSSRLSRLPFAEDLGVVLNVTNVKIDGITPYNPTILRKDKGYELVFRYDEPNRHAKTIPYFSHIGKIHLNDTFIPTETIFTPIRLQSNYTEDPRALTVNNNIYLFYNALDEERLTGRYMAAACLESDTFQPRFITQLDMNLSPIEKNWNPFEYIDETGKAHLMIEYQIHPRKILALENPTENVLHQLPLARKDAYPNLQWPKKWGRISGGAPAQKIGSEYLGFFHSWWEEQGIIWFVIGAYTFEAKPPFRLTSISPHPILFRGIFNTPITHTADFNKRVIYPGGFIHEQGLIHLACGENDCAIKIITMDLDKLKQTLVRLD